MNSQTGDIFTAFDEKTIKANFGKPLSTEEALSLRELPNTQERLRRYKQVHADDKCQKCALRLREHTLKEWQYCEFVLGQDGPEDLVSNAAAAHAEVERLKTALKS